MTNPNVLLCLLLLQMSLGWCANRTFVSPKSLDLAQNYTGIRIIDGHPAAPGQFPYQVAIIFKTDEGAYFCGGSIIGEQWILTAGHCARGAQTFTVYMGGVTVNGNEDGSIQVHTSNYILHPEYNSNSLYADIGLLHLSDSISFNDKIRPITLTTESLYVGEKVDMTVSGYGATSDNSGVSNTLNYVDLSSITNSECASIYGSTSVTDGSLCARGHPSQSTCGGDSGGPLVINNDGVTTQVGVVSWVYAGGCGAGYPSGYSRLSYYRKWIRDQTGI